MSASAAIGDRSGSCWDEGQGCDAHDRHRSGDAVEPLSLVYPVELLGIEYPAVENPQKTRANAVALAKRTLVSRTSVGSRGHKVFISPGISPFRKFAC